MIVVIRLALTLLTVSVLSQLTACSVVSTAPPPTETFYRLPPPETVAAVSHSPFKGGLYVATPLANPLHQDRAMIFSTDLKGISLQTYHYHQWVDALPNLVREYMVAYLQKAGMADWVTGSERIMTGDYTIQGRLQRFEQTGGQQKPQLVVHLRLWLTRQNAKPLLGKDYKATIEMSGVRPEDMVESGQQALAEIMQGFVADVAKLR